MAYNSTDTTSGLLLMNSPVDIKELANFLHEANKNTYANKDAQKVASSC